MTTKEKKTVRNFQGVPKNLRHVSSLGGWVRVTRGKKNSNWTRKGAYKAEGHKVRTCVHDPFTDPQESENYNNERVNEIQTKGESEWSVHIFLNKKVSPGTQTTHDVNYLF